MSVLVRARPAALALRHLAGTLVGWAFETAGGPPAGLPVGPGAADPAFDGRPVALVLLLRADPDAVADSAADLVAATRAGGPRAVLILDSPHFAAARRAGVAADHVLSREDWQRRYPGRPWASYLDGELRRLRHDYATRHVIELPAAGSRALAPGQLDRMLRPPAGPASWPPVRGWRRAVARLERRIDRGGGG